MLPTGAMQTMHHDVPGDFRIVDGTDISVPDGPTLAAKLVLNACLSANRSFITLRDRQPEGISIFEILDLRMLSGLVGEVVAGMLARESGVLIKNPNIDGYPDLLSADTQSRRDEIASAAISNPSFFIKYPHGGIELKNTFGVKSPKAKDLVPGLSRIGAINRRLEWKAHHRRTNHLLGLFSDFVDGCPQVVAAMYCDHLDQSDWSSKQQPKQGSAMTSFSVLQASGFEKMRKRVLFCRSEAEYLDFLFSDLPLRRRRGRPNDVEHR